MNVQRVSSPTVLLTERTHEPSGLQMLCFNVTPYPLLHTTIEVTMGTLKDTVGETNDHLVYFSIKI